MVAVLPMFGLIVLGLVLRRFSAVAEGFWPGAERLNYFVLFPVLLFTSLAKTRWSFDLAFEVPGPADRAAPLGAFGVAGRAHAVVVIGPTWRAGAGDASIQ